MRYFLSIFALFLLLSVESLHAQQQYIVDGQTYTLNTEVEGTLTLLWNTIDGEYRYFSKKGNQIEDLKNKKQKGGYKEEYKEILKQQTSDATVPTENLRFTLPNLSTFFEEYNKKIDPNFVQKKKEESMELQLRLGVFAGISNSVYTENPTNALQPIAGIDLELADAVKLKRHALVLRFKQTFESSDYKYSASQISLNYRFKFVKTSRFDAFVNVKFAAFTYSKKEIYVLSGPEDTLKLKSFSGSDFSAPVTFGVGADYKVGNGYITFNYNDIVALSVDSNDEFPIDFALGYKFNL
ncbi:MAG: hypothetical protein ACTIJ9_02180 [Aequorivita sp.]